jgi:hypothetical protein
MGMMWDPGIGGELHLKHTEREAKLCVLQETHTQSPGREYVSLAMPATWAPVGAGAVDVMYAGDMSRYAPTGFIMGAPARTPAVAAPPAPSAGARPRSALAEVAPSATGK